MKKRSVLIAHDEHETVLALERHLTEAGFEIQVARDGYSALTKARIMSPDLILLDLMIGGLRGLEVKNRLNREATTLNIPVIFLTDRESTEDKIQSFNLKAEDVITKPFNYVELTARIDSLSRRYRELDHALVTDVLSKLNNLHVFRRSIDQLFSVAQRYKRPFSLAVIDVDHFKSINDLHGHAAGDNAIREIARCMQRSFRETDILIRYGGDEFVTLFPETGEEEAREGVERFRAAVKEASVTVNEQTKIPLSVSIGLATYSTDMHRPIELFELADKRMYEEKASKKAPVSTQDTKPRKVRTKSKN